MGMPPHARHAGPCLQKDPAPAGCPPGHLSVTRALAQAGGEERHEPSALSPPVPSLVPLPRPHWA